MKSTPLGDSALGPLFDIRSPAPSAPGSRTSRMTALLIDGPFRRKMHRKVGWALASVYPDALTREQIAERTGYKESGLCGRLAELRPLWVEAIEAGGKTASGITVDTYRLTPSGFAKASTLLEEFRGDARFKTGAFR